VYNPRVTDDESAEIIVTSEPISVETLAAMAAATFGDMVKGVVDIKLRLLALGGGLHSDEEAEWLAQGSAQEGLWGINIYPERPRSDWIEFDSMINVRPRQGNRSRGVDDANSRELIAEIVGSLII